MQNNDKKDSPDAERVRKERFQPDLKNKDVKETDGPKGLEPTRYGDWERKGRCVDF